MDILQLQYFQTIARLENMTKASEILYVAQPNLSTSIKRLEQDLGVSLFERRRGKIKLTPTGKMFLRYVDNILGQLDEGIETIRRSEQHASEIVRVASVIVDLMGILLPEFLPDHPEVQFHQFNCRNSEVAGKVLGGEADFGFVFGYPKEHGLEHIEIDSCERIVQLSKSHPLAARDSLSLRDLEGERLICNLSRDDADMFSELSRFGRIHTTPFYECDDNRVEISMILSGGISIAPVSNYLKIIHSEPDLPMTCVQLREALPLVRLGMIRKSGVHLSRASLQFYEIVSRFFLRESQIAQDFLHTLPGRDNG